MISYKLIFKKGEISASVSFVILLLFHSTQAKKTTTEDAVIYENDQEKTQKPEPMPGPSIFEYQDSEMTKVKRANVHPRYYEMINDEVYVFEPSPLGMNPFMEAIHSDFESNSRAANEASTQHTQHNHEPQRSRNHQQQSNNNGNRNDYNRGEQQQYSQTNHNRNQPQNNPPQLHQPQSNPHQESPHPQPTIPNIPFIHQRQNIPVIDEIPIMIPPPSSSNAQPYQGPFTSTFVEQLVGTEAESHPHSKTTENTNLDVNPNKENDISASSTRSRGCTTSNERGGQCAPFRSCYPVVFNMIDGQLRDQGLAKILYQAAGPCYENGERRYGDKKVIPGIVENDPDIPYDFYNQTICCASYDYTNNFDRNPPESKTMRPSPPDPRVSPPEFQDDTKNHFEVEYTTEEEVLPLEEGSSDYYVDEYNDDMIDTTTDTPRLIAKKNKTSSKNITVESSSDDGADMLKEEIPAKTAKEGNQSKSESSRSDVKVENKSKIHLVKVVKKKVKQNFTRDLKDQVRNESIISSSPSKPEGLVPFTIDPPELSAWKCPGRKVVMPRGHWPWMVALLNEGNHFCSGSLIDHRHILTSSSCVANFQGKDIGRIRVILGDRVLYSSVDGPHMWRKVSRITRHLQFEHATMENDIAIVEMEYPVSYTQNIQPINLPASGNRSHVSKGIVSGWSGADIGKKRFFAPRATVDSVAEFMEPEECNENYEGFVAAGISKTVMCTRPTKSSCKADPGAPLMMKTNNCWHVIGILSHGLRCGSFPDMFTDTSKYIPWIQKNIRQRLPL